MRKKFLKIRENFSSRTNKTMNRVLLGLFWSLGWMAITTYGLGKIIIGSWLPSYSPIFVDIFIINWWIPILIFFPIILVFGFACHYSTSLHPIIQIFLLTLYSIFNGMFISPITALAMGLGINIAVALGLTAGISLIAGLIGWVKQDMSSWQNWLLGLLICGIIASLINLFIPATGFTLLVSIGVIIIFIPLIMYDINQIKYNLEEDKWIRGVIELFLDFVNIFIRILYILILLAMEED
ncbi:MAG: Bax inhibitor-1/YccA family protein [Promethearchaeota archaeon]